MLAPPITLAHVLNAEESGSALRIPISLKVHDQTVSTTALIDSGAEGQFIDSKFIIRNRIPTHPLTKPIPVLNVDGTPNQNGTITHYAWRFLKLGPKHCAAKLLVTSLGKESLILGLPWLKRHNPTIDWQAHTVTIKRTSTATTLAQQAGETATDNKPVTRIPAVYSRFNTLFEKKAASRLPEHRPYDHAINLKPDFLPKDCKTYPLTPKENIATMEFINENLEKGYIRPSKSPMASPFFFVGKKDSTLRPCQDYRHVNEGTIKDAYPFPLIPDLMDKLKGAKFFTKLDLRSGYNNVQIKSGDEWKAAFKTSKGLFEPLVMFFGLCNSPATFQRFMDDIFRIEIINGGIVIYMDDILIFAATLEQLRAKTLRVLQVLKDNDLFLKPEKCTFEVQQVEFLGMIVTPNEIHMDPTKLSGIKDWPIPTTIKQLRSFLGFCNFYRRFIPKYSDITHPLHELTRANVKWQWTPERNQAFEQGAEQSAQR